MPEDVDLGFALGLQPREAVGYFRSKGYDISWNWWDTWQERHAQAFTVAKAARLDVLQTIRAGLDRALREGRTEAEFVADLEPALRRAGWWGRQVVVDPAGGAEMVRLGSPSRLKTIYRTNMRTVRSAGRYRRQMDNAEDRPYLVYDAILDASTRPSHAAFDGQCFRADDPIWDTHYPPNGFNCRCRVRALTARQVEARGIEVRDSRDGLRQVMQEAGVDKRSGEIVRRPGTEYSWSDSAGSHALAPDPGWSYNPGQGAALFDARTDRLGRLDTTPDPAVLPGQRSWRDHGLPAALPRRPAPPRLPPDSDAAAAKRTLWDAIGAPPGSYRLVETPPGLDDVTVTDRFVDHLVDHHPRSDAREQFARFVLPTVREPDEVWLTAVVRRGRVVYRRLFLAGFEGDTRQTLFVAQENLDGSLAWTFYPPDRPGQYRRGRLLYSRPGEG